MIGADLPQRLTSLHSVKANQGIHNGMLKTMPHMQSACHIWRRNGNAIRSTFSLRSKVAFLFPGPVPAIFDLLRLKSLVHLEL